MSQRKAYVILGAAFAIETFHEEEISDGLGENSNPSLVAHFACFHVVNPSHEFGIRVEMRTLIGRVLHNSSYTI
ncbi:MAG: hypothetical protein KF749_05020 [Bacteroidetes bacterium]|nr:hypothetical protein [Bacteroidota bacterium]MCW5896502.1 hypothetical protein [Bacteroidota bacterium]